MTINHISAKLRSISLGICVMSNWVKVSMKAESNLVGSGVGFGVGVGVGLGLGVEVGACVG